MIVPRFAAVVTDKGELRISDPVVWRTRVSGLRGKEVWVTVQARKAARSLTANAYLWVCYTYLAAWSGHDPEEIHEAMKDMFLPRRESKLPSGEVLSAPGSTTVLDTLEFSEYVSKVKRFGAENGCYIPEPGEVEVSL